MTWAWVRVRVAENLASPMPFAFEFGGAEDKPDDDGEVCVIFGEG